MHETVQFGEPKTTRFLQIHSNPGICDRQTSIVQTKHKKRSHKQPEKLHLENGHEFLPASTRLLQIFRQLQKHVCQMSKSQSKWILCLKRQIRENWSQRLKKSNRTHSCDLLLQISQVFVRWNCALSCINNCT